MGKDVFTEDKVFHCNVIHHIIYSMMGFLMDGEEGVLVREWTGIAVNY